MKSKFKRQIVILIMLGICTTLSTFYPLSLTFNPRIGNASTDDTHYAVLNDKQLKMSKVSERIHIDNNWTDALAAGICTGAGTYLNPYLLEDLIIDGGGQGDSILIENSEDYFIIENCTTYSTGYIYQYAGIHLSHVKNAQLVNNNCSNDNLRGIYLDYSHNITISNNFINHNFNGISLSHCENNSIIENTIYSNSFYGIYIDACKNNTISNCKIGDNDVGLFLQNSVNHTISGNLLDDCGIEFFYSSIDNLISHEIDTMNQINTGILYYYTDAISLRSQNFTNAGQVVLVNCNDSIISDLNISHTNTGISLFYCNNNTIYKNFAEKNHGYGIKLDHSYYNNVSENSANENSEDGIFLGLSDYNVISKNRANKNSYHGIQLRISNYNNITNNILLGNSKCIDEFDCEGNYFNNNNCGIRNISGFDLLLLIGIISVSTIILKRNIKKS